jgi:hypothetical protein
MKSKDDKSEDGSDQERKYFVYILLRYCYISVQDWVLVPDMNFAAMRYVVTYL